MFYDAKSIANYFLELAAESGQRIDAIKLQKLVYFANGWYAGYTSQPLIDEPVEAWTHGPMIASLFHEFIRYGTGPIKGKAMQVVSHSLIEVEAPDDPTLRRFLLNIWQVYGNASRSELHGLTHQSDGPWCQVRETAQGMKTADIPFALIADHFRPMAEAVRQGSAQ